MNKKLRAVINLALYTVIYFVILFSELAVVKYFAMNNRAFYDWYMMNQDTGVIINDVVSLIIFGIIFKYTHKQSLLVHCKFKKVDAKAIAVLALVGLCVGLFTTALVRSPFVAARIPQLGDLVDALFIGSTVICFLLFLIIGSIYKEILFRGIYFNDLKELMPFVVALIVQGLMYGVYFFFTSIPLIVYGLFGAVLFGLIYTWFDSIWAPIAVQITSTGGMWILCIFKGEFVRNNYYAIIVLSFIAIVGGIYYLLKNKSDYAVKKEIVNSTNKVSKGA